MTYIQPESRIQIIFTSLEEGISSDNPVRVIDAFIDNLDLADFSFKIAKTKLEGRPAFHPKALLKLYFYGYLNGLRSSRRLEKECLRNMEVRWLLGGLAPNYHTIADFRKDNPKALKAIFKHFVLFLKGIDLVDGEVVAVDGTKIRASNSKKSNFSQQKLANHIAYIETKTNEYLNTLEQNDQNEQNEEQVNQVSAQLARLAKQKAYYESLSKQLAANNETQISTTDPDAKALLVQGQLVEIGYNQQAAVDKKYKLVVATHTINQNDRNALANIAFEAKENLSQAEGFTLLADKGYFNGKTIAQTQSMGINTIVAKPETVNSNPHGTTKAYLVDKFKYNEVDDTYTCPAGQTLTTTGNWHQKAKEKQSYQYKKYRTPACKTCQFKHLCTGRAKGGRELERSQYAAAVAINNTNYSNNSSLYRERQEINEHIFGTIKRYWGYTHTNLRGLAKVNGEFALIMTVYNLKRTLNILGTEKLLAYIKRWKPSYIIINLRHIKQAKTKGLAPTENSIYKMAA